MKRFVFDPNRCTGCQACVVGCWAEHAPRQSQPWRTVHPFNPLRHPDLPAFSLSLACNHCDEPACLEQCPALAYRVDPMTGAVLHDADACIGCRYCIWVCPYDAPRFDPDRGIVEKCTFCVERLHAGRDPACVTACPVEALGVEDRPEGSACPDLPGFPASDLGPGIRIVPLRGAGPAVDDDRRDRTVLDAWMETTAPAARIGAAGEWTLIALTWTFGVLAGVAGAAALGGVRPSPPAMLAAGGLAMALSTAHLGRPERAWRALRNLRRSWLSREVALLGLFLVLIAAWSVWPALVWGAAGAGLAATVAMDRVYQKMAGGPGLRPHSAQTTASALYLLGILGGVPWLAVAVGTAKLALYLGRRRHPGGAGGLAAAATASGRIALGFGGPLLAWWGGWDPAVAAALAALGDLLDRVEFYDGLDLASPQAESDRAARRRLVGQAATARP